MIKAGIVGGTGYTAGELIRLLTFHPDTDIEFVFSTSMPGKAVTSVHTDLVGDIELVFSGEINHEIDILFLCMGHGKSRSFLEKNPVPNNVKVIDLSRDFRLADHDHLGERSFTYGLPELHAAAITESENIANPGCYATGIQMGILPLAKKGMIENELHVHGITGSTGAGQSPSDTTHFSWRNNNVSIYKAFNHQHLDEIRQSIRTLQSSFDSSINFIPVRGNFARGIFITTYLQTDITEDSAVSLYKEYYKDAPYTHVSSEPVDLKQVVGTNKCILHLQKTDGKLLITSVIDNLLKGASGQAIQNMNLMFGLNESSGLNLKSTRF